MKCLGLIGGHGVEATAYYARQIENELWQRYEDQHSANLVALSLQTRDLAEAMSQRNWPAVGQAIASGMNQLTSLGAEGFLLCSSELHVGAESMDNRVPVLHIAEPTVRAVQKTKHLRITLLGACSAEEEKLWQDRLRDVGVEVLLPVVADRQHLTKLLRQQFERGLLNEEARADVLRITNSLRQAGARSAVVISPALAAIFHDTVPVLPIFDAAELHAMAAVDWMTSNLARVPESPVPEG